MRVRKTPPLRKDDCLTVCLSRLLEINYEEVPFYGKKSAANGWLSKLTIWANKRGYELEVAVPEEYDTKDKKIIAVGRSPSGRDNDHAVIVDENLKVIFDPAYNKRRSIKNIGYLLAFKELEMAKKETKCCGGKIAGVYRRGKLKGFMCSICQKSVKNDGSPAK